MRESLERIWLKTANQTSLSCKLSSNDGASRARLTSLDVHSPFPSAIAACPHQTLKPSQTSPLASAGRLGPGAILQCQVVVTTTGPLVSVSYSNLYSKIKAVRPRSIPVPQDQAVVASELLKVTRLPPTKAPGREAPFSPAGIGLSGSFSVFVPANRKSLSSWCLGT